jgi:hypothetical protein
MAQPGEKLDPNHPGPTGDVITDHLVEDGLLVEAAAVDEETIQAAETEDIEAVEQADVERIEREELQRHDPAEDDLPDRAFDRITAGV